MVEQIGRMMGRAMAERKERDFILLEFSLREPDGPYRTWPKIGFWRLI